MRLNHIVSLFSRTSVAALYMTCALPAHAQTPGTFTALAKVTSSTGTSVESPFTISVKRFATDAERDALLDAVKKGGTDAARLMLTKQPDAGTLQLGGRTTAVKYAYVRSLGSGRLITAITGEPIVFIGAGVPNAKPTKGYALGVVMFEVPEKGAGQGELVPAAQIRVDAQNAIVTEDYSKDNVVRLTNVGAK